MEDKFIVQTSTPERKFVKVYLDFLNARLLSGKEQIIFIHLKQYINFANDTGTVRGEVYPTLATLAKNVKMSEKTVRTVLQELQKKGILEIKQQGMNKPNIYKINDSAGMWKADNAEELKAVVNEIEEKRMIDLLTAKGYYISKEKGLASDSDQTADTSTMNYNSSTENNSTISVKSQVERYNMEQIKELFDYAILIADHPEHEADLQVVFDILYEVLNTGKPTVRVSGEDKPQAVVAGKLMKLTHYDIHYAIDKFHEQTGEIKNARAYLLTIIYHSREQSYLELMNLGHRNGDF